MWWNDQESAVTDATPLPLLRPEGGVGKGAWREVEKIGAELGEKGMKL